ncbi:MAG: non-canonical purine NTP pyrophosphatase [archaeon]
MDIYFATTNEKKLSIRKDLEKDGIKIIQEPIELTEPRSSHVRDIAEAKINEAYSIIQKPTIVIDAGFYINALNGFPRAYVNFALETIGLEGILSMMEGKRDRSCEFRECLAYMDETLKEPKYFIAHVKGRLAYMVRGKMEEHLWSELGRIFIPDNHTKTLSEMNVKEYNKWRHKEREEHSLGTQLYKWIFNNKFK